MACSISISNVVATESSGKLTSLTVNGTVTDCPELDITVTCGSTSVKKTVAGSATSGSWSAVFSASELGSFSCACGSQVRVDVVCRMNPQCSNWQLETIQCCPTVDIQVDQSDCKADGTKPVTISATITPAPNSTTPVQADLILDGPVVDSGIASSVFATLSLSYSTDLASGSHTACVQVNQPPCGTQCQTFAFECKGDDGENSEECKKTYKKWFCPLLFLIMTLSFAFGIGFLILSNCVPLATILTAASVNLATIGTAFLLVGLIAFVLYGFFPDCRKCLCGWGYKLFWRVLFTVGTVIATLAGCCGYLLYPGLGTIAVGLLCLYLWASNCKKSVCEVVKEVIFVIATFIFPPLVFLLSFSGLQACLYVFYGFTIWGVILIVFYLLLLYDQANCP